METPNSICKILSSENREDVKNKKNGKVPNEFSRERKKTQIDKDDEVPHRGQLFSIVTYGSSWIDVLVFTVMAENNVWAEEIVRQWLNSNGRENYKIDNVRAIVSRDVRAIVNVGTRLLEA